MSLDFGALVLGAAYPAIGVAATLTDQNASAYALTVIDETAGVQLVEGGIEVQTETPGAYCRATELAALDVSAAALDGMTLTFNGRTWTITSHRPKPSPGGEVDGEYLLLLSDEAPPVIPPSFQKIVSKTADYAVTSSDSGVWFNNAGATGAVTFSLPPAVTGLVFGFVVLAAQPLIVAANASDVIQAGAVASSAGGAAQCATPGALMLLMASEAGTWQAITINGPWEIA